MREPLKKNQTERKMELKKTQQVNAKDSLRSIINQVEVRLSGFKNELKDLDEIIKEYEKFQDA